MFLLHFPCMMNIWPRRLELNTGQIWFVFTLPAVIKDRFTVLILTLIQRMEPGAFEMPEPLGRLSYKSDRDAHWKIQIKPLRETNAGVAQA